MDLQASDYKQGVASQEGKLIMPAGMKKAKARDFETATNMVRYIDLETRFTQKKIVKLASNPLQLEVVDEPLSQWWQTALEVNTQGLSRFETFQRDGEFWIFGNDRFPTDRRVTILAFEQIITVTNAKLLKGDYGEHVWISVQSSEEAVVAVSSNLSKEPLYRSTIDFYKVLRVATTTDEADSESGPTFKVYEYDKPIFVDSEVALTSATFIDSDFAFLPDEDEGPLLFRMCPQSSYLHSGSNLCTACPPGSVTFKLLQSQCTTC